MHLSCFTVLAILHKNPVILFIINEEMKNSFFVPKILWHFSVDDLFKKITLGLDKILGFYSNCLIDLFPWKIFGKSLILIKIIFVFLQNQVAFYKMTDNSTFRSMVWINRAILQPLQSRTF